MTRVLHVQGWPTIIMCLMTAYGIAAYMLRTANDTSTACAGLARNHHVCNNGITQHNDICARAADDACPHVQGWPTIRIWSAILNSLDETDGHGMEMAWREMMKTMVAPSPYCSSLRLNVHLRLGNTALCVPTPRLFMC